MPGLNYDNKYLRFSDMLVLLFISLHYFCLDKIKNFEENSVKLPHAGSFITISGLVFFFKQNYIKFQVSLKNYNTCIEICGLEKLNFVSDSTLLVFHGASMF